MESLDSLHRQGGVSLAAGRVKGPYQPLMNFFETHELRTLAKAYRAMVAREGP